MINEREPEQKDSRDSLTKSAQSTPSGKRKRRDNAQKDQAFILNRSILRFGVNLASVLSQRNPNPKHVELLIVKYAQQMANRWLPNKTDGLDTYFSAQNPI